MKQEDYNDMMRLPGERVRQASRLPVCPKCGEAYCGNGKSLCVECEHESASSVALEVSVADEQPWPTPRYAEEIVFEGRARLAIAPEEYEALYNAHADLRAKLEAAERDAARYRWLRGDAPPHSTRWVRWDIRYWAGTYWDVPRGEEVDDRIDTAMREEAARGGERG